MPRYGDRSSASHVGWIVFAPTTLSLGTPVPSKRKHYVINGMTTAEDQSATADWTHGILPKPLMSLARIGKMRADPQLKTVSSMHPPLKCACHRWRTTTIVPLIWAQPYALLVITSSTDNSPEARGPRSRSGPRGTQARPAPTCILSWVRGAGQCPELDASMASWAALAALAASPGLAPLLPVVGMPVVDPGCPALPANDVTCAGMRFGVAPA